MGRKKKEPVIDPEFEKVMEEFHELYNWWQSKKEEDKKLKEAQRKVGTKDDSNNL